MSTRGRNEKGRLGETANLGSKGRYLWAAVNPEHRRNHSQLGEELPAISVLILDSLSLCHKWRCVLGQDM